MSKQYNPDRYHRHSQRRLTHDYFLNGVYSVTIRTHNRACLFGSIEKYGIKISAAGQMLIRVWKSIPKQFCSVSTDAFVIMPDHIHCILIIEKTTNNGVESCEPVSITSGISLGKVMKYYKSMTTVQYCNGVNENGWPVIEGHLWQRNYHDRIIRSYSELEIIRQYIANNPKRCWLKYYGSDP